jgi:hypothetical protein
LLLRISGCLTTCLLFARLLLSIDVGCMLHATCCLIPAACLPLPLPPCQFWEGGVKGRAFITSPLLPKAFANSSWAGLAHACDLYVTLATLGGVARSTIVNGSGPMPPDGHDLWPALLQVGVTISPRSGIFGLAAAHVPLLASRG